MVDKTKFQLKNIRKLLYILNNFLVAWASLWLLVGITYAYAEQEFVTLAEAQLLKVRFSLWA